MQICLENVFKLHERKREDSLIEDGPTFINRSSIDIHFAEVVSKIGVSNCHVQQFSSAIQKYTAFTEHIGKKFVIKNGNVIELLDVQKIFQLDQLKNTVETQYTCKVD